MGGAHSRSSAQRAAAANDVARLQEVRGKYPQERWQPWCQAKGAVARNLRVGKLWPLSACWAA